MGKQTQSLFSKPTILVKLIFFGNAYFGRLMLGKNVDHPIPMQISLLKKRGKKTVEFS